MSKEKGADEWQERSCRAPNEGRLTEEVDIVSEMLKMVSEFV